MSFLTTLKKINNFLISHFEFILTVVCFAFVYSFIFIVLDTSYVITNTTVTGGDTGSHVYIPYYLKEVFPLIKWWSPDWYSGFPFFYFYPPLLYVLTVILSFAIPLNVSFKLTIFSVVLLYPLSSYLTLKWLSCKTPIPQLGAVFSLFLIFLEKFSIYGGNLPSLLSGQFSHTASIAFLFMFLGLMYKGVIEKKYLVFNILLGSAIMLSHPTSGLLLIPLALFFVFQTKDLRKNFLYVFYVFLGIFLITSFWTLSLLYYQGYAGVMKWTKEIKLDYLLPPHWLLLNASAVFGLLLAFIRKEIKFLGIAVLTTTCLLAYFFLDNSSVWNTRFLPYILFSILLFAAYFLGLIISLLRKNIIATSYLIVFLLMFFALSTVRTNISYSPYWFKWNFEGYEVKQPWSEANNLFSYLKTLPNGRVMWEYHPDFGKYGTPRILETIPSFTKQPTFEGLLIESGLTGPFHFINQTETSERPTAAIAGFEYPPFDFNRGVKHLQMSGAKYFVAYSQKIKSEADKSTALIKIKTTYPFNVYKIHNSKLVEPVKTFIVEKKGNNWLKRSIEWYKGNNLDEPIVFANNDKQVKEIYSFNKGTSDARIENIKTTRDSIEFDVSKVNQSYIVKISYFPTWKAEGAKGPFLVSPAYMMVIPTQNHVKLYFAYGWVDWLGIVLSIGGVGYLFFINKLSPKIFKKS
jgi:uncharacterized membrane protein